jgi:hypothetical protein
MVGLELQSLSQGGLVPSSVSASLGTGANRCTNALTWASGSAPMNWSTTWPLRMAKTAGMDWTWKVWAMRGFSSTLTLANSTAPPVSATAFSSMGPRVVQGPHHGAHRSTITGTVALRASTSPWKVWSVTSIGPR